MKVGIIKYNAGNIRSVSFALERLGVEPIVSSDASVLNNCDKVIFPGVGEASSAMSFLKEKKLDHVILNLKQPVLGICLGMQLMCNYSEEGDTTCLGIFNQKVKKFNEGLKVPQIGWNSIQNVKYSNAKLLNGLRQDEYMYFVHSYYAELSDDTIATTNYGLKFSAALQKNNFYATQFHPEKSGRSGQLVLENFLKYT